MKLSILAPWLCAGALLVVVLLLVRSNQQKDAELAAARESANQAEQFRQALEHLEGISAAQSNQLQQAQNEHADLMRLRNEVRQLHDQNQQLGKQVRDAQADVGRMQVQAEAAAQRAQVQAQAQPQVNGFGGSVRQGISTPAERQAAYEASIRAVVDANGGAGTSQGQAADRCINTLRQIDGAKQQWALEKQKSASDTPTREDIMPYLPAGTQGLTCPGGGTYAINSISSSPTCSVAGHVLPR
jgi:chromosome segregation ATPase